MFVTDIEYAVREAINGLGLSRDKAVRFVMRAESVDRRTAERAVDLYLNKYVMSQ
jgi:hypothetical protein